MYRVYAIVVLIVSIALAIPTYGLSMIAPFVLVNWTYAILNGGDEK